MPTSKKVGKYPAHFIALAQQLPPAEPLALLYPTEREARRARLQLYGFSSALHEEENPLAANLDATELLVRGTTLVLRSRDSTIDPIKLLVNNAQPPLTTIEPPPVRESVAMENAVSRWLKGEASPPITVEPPSPGETAEPFSYANFLARKDNDHAATPADEGSQTRAGEPPSKKEGDGA